MPKYDDYREWERYREQKLEEVNRLRKLGITSTETVPSLPPEGIDKWNGDNYK